MTNEQEQERLYFSSLEATRNNREANVMVRFLAKHFGKRFEGQDTDLANIRYLEVTRFRKKLYFVQWIEKPSHFEDTPESLYRLQQKKLKAVESNRIYAKGEKLTE